MCFRPISINLVYFTYQCILNYTWFLLMRSEFTPLANVPDFTTLCHCALRHCYDNVLLAWWRENWPECPAWRKFAPNTCLSATPGPWKGSYEACTCVHGLLSTSNGRSLWWAASDGHGLAVCPISHRFCAILQTAEPVGPGGWCHRFK